jgi:CHRD domain-containing protein
MNRPLERQRLAAVLLGIAFLCSVRALAAQSGETFKARLSTVPIDVTMMSTVAGSGSLTAVLAGNKLTITGTFQGLRTPATLAKIHRAPKGIRGPAILDLTVSKETSGTVSGSIELTPAQLDDLRNSRLYVQIDSERAPDGNLWGWLLPARS